MCDKAVDDSLTALKPFPDWFVTNTMIKKLFTAVYADEKILYFYEGSGDAVFNCSGMILILLFLLDFWLCMLNLENAKNLKKS